MLQVAQGTKKNAVSFDRRKRPGVTASSDIWSLGCLLYEIVTGEYLYSDKDFGAFFLMTTQHRDVSNQTLFDAGS